MIRPILSTLIAAVATVGGLAIELIAAGDRVRALATFQLGAAVLPTALMILGVLLLGASALTLAIHWLGVLVVGIVHLVFGALAVLVPPSGASSPTLLLTNALRGVSPDLVFGGLALGLSGTQLVLGAFLVAAALSGRARRAARPGPTSAVAALVGAVALIGAVVLVGTFGGALAEAFTRTFRLDVALVLAVLGAAVLAAIGGVSLRWTPLGGVIGGAIVLLAGLAVLVAGVALPVWLMGAAGSVYGLGLILGASFLGAGAGAAIRRRPTD